MAICRCKWHKGAIFIKDHKTASLRQGYGCQSKTAGPQDKKYKNENQTNINCQQG